jgi:3-hydroxyacyl-[acyl-carrier-protein] dehydratase
MAKPLLNYEQVRGLLKQRFPMLMVDCVLELDPGKSIKALKNVTGNEIQLLGHFPEQAVFPGTLIIEAVGQTASLLFSETTGTGMGEGEFVVLGTVMNARFLEPVRPGDQMELNVKVLKQVNDIALVEGSATVDGTTVATMTLGFGRRTL